MTAVRPGRRFLAAPAPSGAGGLVAPAITPAADRRLETRAVRFEKEQSGR